MTDRTRVGLLATLVTMAHAGVVFLVMGGAPERTHPPRPSPPTTWIALSAPVPAPQPTPSDAAPAAEGAAPRVPGPIETPLPPPEVVGTPSAPTAAPSPEEPVAEAQPPLPPTPPQVPGQEVLARLTYPPQALRRRLEATVVLELTIDETGLVTRAEALEDPGHGFAEAAVRALQGLVVTPAEVAGEPVASRLRYPVRFLLP